MSCHHRVGIERLAVVTALHLEVEVLRCRTRRSRCSRPCRSPAFAGPADLGPRGSCPGARSSTRSPSGHGGSRGSRNSPAPVVQSYGDDSLVAYGSTRTSTATNGVPTAAKQSTPMCVRPPLRGSPNESQHEPRQAADRERVVSGRRLGRRTGVRLGNGSRPVLHADAVLGGASLLNGRPSDCAPACGTRQEPDQGHCNGEGCPPRPAAGPSS